jgi:hypothetical protein
MKKIKTTFIDAAITVIGLGGVGVGVGILLESIKRLTYPESFNNLLFSILTIKIIYMDNISLYLINCLLFINFNITNLDELVMYWSNFNMNFMCFYYPNFSIEGTLFYIKLSILALILYYPYIEYVITLFHLEDVYNAIRNNHVCSNILDGGDSVRATSILGQRTPVRQQEFFNAFQEELYTSKSIADFVKDHITRRMLQAPIFERPAEGFTLISNNEQAAALMERNNIYIPKVLIYPRDHRDVELILAFSNRPAYNVIVSNIQNSLYNDFINNLINKDVINSRTTLWFTGKHSLSFVKRLFILLHDSYYFLRDFNTNLSNAVNLEIQEASKDCVYRCIYFTDLIYKSNPFSWQGKKYLMPLHYVEDHVYLNFWDSVHGLNLKLNYCLDSYSLEYYKRLRGSFYCYDIQNHKIRFSKYVENKIVDRRAGRGLSEQDTINYYTPNFTYITWIKNNLQDNSINYKNGDMVAYIQELKDLRLSKMNDILAKEKFVEDYINHYCLNKSLKEKIKSIFF